MAGKRRRNRRGWGAIRTMRSGRYQASFIGPDGRRWNAPQTYVARIDAEGWLARRRDEIRAGKWAPAHDDPPKVPTFEEYARAWLAGRDDLKPSTASHYRRILDRLVYSFGPRPLDSITSEDVRIWHAGFARDRPTIRAHSYALFNGIMGAARAAGHIDVNPCTLKSAGRTTRASETKVLTPAELGRLAALMPERYRALTLLTGWCALRFGEATELRRRDIDLDTGTLHIRRAVSRVDGQILVGTPKSAAGRRDIAIPPHILPALAEHIARYADVGKDGLLFPAAHGGHLNPASVQHPFYAARAELDRPDLRWHDLRHCGATYAAQSGATLRELMDRLGHSTTSAALRYQHAAADRDRIIAARLSEMAREG